MNQNIKKKNQNIEKILDLSKRMSEGDSSAREELILSHLPLVETLTSKLLQPGLEWDDMYQEGCLGLIQAVDKFDYRRRVSLNTYASYWIKRRIKRASFSQNRNMPLYPKEALFYNVCRYRSAYDYLYMLKERNPTNAEIAAETGQPLELVQFISEHIYQVVSLQDIVSGDDSTEPTTLEDILISPYTPTLSAEDAAFRRMAIFDPKEWGVTLTRRELLVLRHHLGFTPSGTPETFAAISSASGWGLETVRQYYLVAIHKIKTSCLEREEAEATGPPTQEEQPNEETGTEEG